MSKYNKTFLLDTNVLLHEPDSVVTLSENNTNRIVIPIVVLEELDKLKTGTAQINFNARTFIRSLESNKILVDIDINKYTFPESIPIEANKPDNLILACVYNNPDFILVTKDINLRIKARALNLKAVDFISDTSNYSPYFGHTEIEVDEEFIENFYKDETATNTFQLNSNQYILFRSSTNKKHTALGQYKIESDSIVLVNSLNNVFGITSKNIEQTFALDALLDPSIPLVALTGLSGSGKTLLSLAAALQSKAKYKQIYITRQVVPVGNDIGFLPGTALEKIRPYLEPFYDNLKYLKSLSKTNKDIIEKAMDVENPKIEVAPVTYIRGRSIPQVFFIIDECFPYNQEIITDRGKLKIGSLFTMYIKHKELPKVKTFNEETKKFEYKPIVRVIYNGVRELVEVKAGLKKIKCTQEERFLTLSGWKEADKLLDTDYIVTPEHSLSCVVVPNEIQKQVIIGSFLGGGHIQSISNDSSRLSVIHGIAQKDYAEFKASLFGSKVRYIEKNGYAQIQAVEFNTPAFTKVNFASNKASTQLSNMSEIALAIWFMDGGLVSTRYKHVDNRSDTALGITLHTEGFSIDVIHEIVEVINNKFELNAVIVSSGKYKVIRIYGEENTTKFYSIVYPYIHEDLMYKIPEKYRIGTTFDWNSDKNVFYATKVDYVKKTGTEDHVFDMEVEDNHNFIAAFGSSLASNHNGFVVHNCQNLTPNEIKTIITRAGEGTKIVLLGDTDQIDAPYLDKRSNGLTYVINKFKNNKLFSYIHLKRGERSLLAEEASKIL